MTQPYIPALKYHALTGLYDNVVRLTTRETVFKAALVDLANPQPGEQLLDVGCGTGTLTGLFAQQEPKLACVGLDADPVQLKHAAKKFGAPRAELRFEQGYAQQLPFSPQSFDLAVSSLFFHHLTTRQKRDALTEIVRVLKPGGRLIIADWGQPSSLIQRGLFFLVQLLDGFETTQDSVRGALPVLMQGAGFVEVENRGSIPTILGTIRLFQANKSR